MIIFSFFFFLWGGGGEGVIALRIYKHLNCLQIKKLEAVKLRKSTTSENFRMQTEDWFQEKELQAVRLIIVWICGKCPLVVTGHHIMNVTI